MWLDKDLSESDKILYKNIFHQITGAEFIDILNEKFVPFLESLNFKGSKNNFYKHNSPWIYTVNIFKDKYGGECALNVGVHLDFIENTIDKLPIPSKFSVSDCIIDKSIMMDNDNPWYLFGKNSIEGHETVDIMIEMFKKKGIPFLSKFENYPIPFSDIEYNDILKPKNKFIQYEITKDKLDWVHFHIFLAKVNFNIGNTDLALKILEKAKNDEYYAKRFEKYGMSPLLERIGKLIKNAR